MTFCLQMCLIRLIYRNICDGLFIGTLKLVPMKKVNFLPPQRHIDS